MCVCKGGGEGRERVIWEACILGNIHKEGGRKEIQIRHVMDLVCIRVRWVRERCRMGRPKVRFRGGIQHHKCCRQRKRKKERTLAKCWK